MDAATAARISYWDAGAPTYRWVDIGLSRILQEPTKSINLQRKIGLYMVAMYDATIATWDAKYTYNRPRPSQQDPSLSTAVAVPSSPSYPSEHAATAAAAAAVLGYFYPEDASRFAVLADQDAQSRVQAGVQYPSDVQTGLDLGHAVAAQVIERAQHDGSDQEWTGSVPSGPGFWNGTNPLFPLGGAWRTWVLTSANQFRPGPPPAWDSPEQAAELDEINGFDRTFDANAKALYAQSPDGIFSSWYVVAGQRIFENHLDTDPPRAARVYALMGVAHNDAYVACWDAKYTYWRIRPFHSMRTFERARHDGSDQEWTGSGDVVVEHARHDGS
jgi:hypothetical protein